MRERASEQASEREREREREREKEGRNENIKHHRDTYSVTEMTLYSSK